jgi:hypothetical protein
VQVSELGKCNRHSQIERRIAAYNLRGAFRVAHLCGPECTDALLRGFRQTFRILTFPKEAFNLHRQLRITIGPDLMCTGTCGDPANGLLFHSTGRTIGLLNEQDGIVSD